MFPEEWPLPWPERVRREPWEDEHFRVRWPGFEVPEECPGRLALELKRPRSRSERQT